MGRLWTKAEECEYKEYDSLLTEWFRGGLYDEGMIDDILIEIAALEDIGDAVS